MPFPKTEKLTPAREIEHLKDIYGAENAGKLYSLLTQSFNVLQNRAQMLLSLITITLTISGFSGPNIAGSSMLARLSIAVGLVLVLFSALVLLAGPLRLSWSTSVDSETTDEALIQLIEQRNYRTRRYHLASFILILGLAAYVTSLISFLITG